MTIRSILGSAALLATLFLVPACGGSGGGNVAFVVSTTGATGASSAGDVSPLHDDCCGDRSLQGARVTFSSILARNLEGVLTDVTIALPVTVDLLALGGGKDATLPAGFLPPGTYDQLVVVMTAVELTLRDGTKLTITPPGGGWTSIVTPKEPFTVVDGQTTTVTLKFRRDLSFGDRGGTWEYHPRFDCDHDRK